MNNNIILKRILSFVMAGITTATVSTGCSHKRNGDGLGNEVVIEDVLAGSGASVERTKDMLMQGSFEVVTLPNVPPEDRLTYKSKDLRIIEVYDPINESYKHWIVYETPLSLLGNYTDCAREEFGFYDGHIDNFNGIKSFSYYVSIQNPEDHFYSSNKYFTGLVDGQQVVGTYTMEVFVESKGVERNYYCNQSKDVISTDSILYYDYCEEFIVHGEHYKSVMPSNEIKLYSFASLFEDEFYTQSELEEILVSFDVKSSLKTDDDIEKTLTLQK